MSEVTLITGSTGLIGRKVIELFQSKNKKVYALARNQQKPTTSVHYVYADLFDKKQISEILNSLRPTHLLHLAWNSTGNFDSLSNYDYLASSINLIHDFYKNGGQRVVMAGTYAEYGEVSGVIDENHPVHPFNNYTKTKCFLNEIASEFCSNCDIEFAWGRVFSAYGLERDHRRLTSYVIDNLLNNQQITIKSGSLVRDYIYVDDVAKAFYELLFSNVRGNINICTGIGTSIHDYVSKIAQFLDKEHLVNFAEIKSNQQTLVIGSNRRLREELQFTPSYGIDEALKIIISQYQSSILSTKS